MSALLKLNSPANSCSQAEIEKAFEISAKTSIFRKGASAPLKHLIKQGLIPSTGSCLNFGKGRCSHDSDTIKSISGTCIDYDYTYCRSDIFGSHFNFVYCGYVTNTLPIAARQVVWSQLASVTDRTNGVCFVAVRSDSDRAIKGKPHEDGVITSKGTFQIGYTAEKIVSEAKEHFAHVELLKVSGFRIVQCKHS